MFLIWQGYGLLGLLIPFIMLLITNIAIDSIFGEGFYSAHSHICATVALFIASAITWFVGKKLNNKLGRILIDPKTNEQIEFKKKHTIFWIPLQWFSIGILASAFLMATS